MLRGGLDWGRLLVPCYSSASSSKASRSSRFIQAANRSAVSCRLKPTLATVIPPSLTRTPGLFSHSDALKVLIFSPLNELGPSKCARSLVFGRLARGGPKPTPAPIRASPCWGDWALNRIWPSAGSGAGDGQEEGALEGRGTADRSGVRSLRAHLLHHVSLLVVRRWPSG